MKLHKKCIGCNIRFQQSDEWFPRTPSGKFFMNRCHACSAVYWEKERLRSERRAADCAVASEVSRRRTESPNWVSLQKKLSKVASGKLADDALFHEVGYTGSTLRLHLERQFLRGMSWQNYAGCLPWKAKVKCWHIDHIVPKSKFLFADRKIAYALPNLRPLWEIDNLRKGSMQVTLL